MKLRALISELKAMSQWVECPRCGGRMELPAFEGDGTFYRHVCEDDDDSVSRVPASRRRKEEPEE